MTTDRSFLPVQPHSGPDTWDLIEDALRQLADRSRRMAWDPLTAITMLASLTHQAERMIPELATEARRKHASWVDIATARGTSPEQAELRCSPGRRSAIRGSPMIPTDHQAGTQDRGERPAMLGQTHRPAAGPASSAPACLPASPSQRVNVATERRGARAGAGHLSARRCH